MLNDVSVAGLLGLQDFLVAAPDRTRKAASMSLNRVIAGSGLSRYRKGLMDEVNFPAGYLNDERFGVDRRASPDNLVASLVARQRPTSLARFAVAGAGKGVTVQVGKGKGTNRFQTGFLVGLNSGNLGLAVRLGPGVKLNKADTSRMVHLEANVVLLYGPSIDQLLNNGVAEKETPQVIDDIATEFYRQFDRLS